MQTKHIDAVVELQHSSFPPPFDPALHWKPEHLLRHLEVYPLGQWVAISESQVIGSCSNTRISEHAWNHSASWDETVGGYFLEGFDLEGSTIFGLDISVHSSARKLGIGRAFYDRRFQLAQAGNCLRYGTVCRIPDYYRYADQFSPTEYVRKVQSNNVIDRTLTPLLRYGLGVDATLEDYLEDPESMNVGCRLSKLLQGVAA
jgi:GNAT superfamily N-acetyltransferase